jgi:hypothetical protein
VRLPGRQGNGRNGLQAIENGLVGSGGADGDWANAEAAMKRRRIRKGVRFMKNMPPQAD